ncbi:MAG: 4-alpha-glucanotransferase [Thermodesulfovibrionia bacterium]
MFRRGSGILMHITSLPSPYGIGDMGRYARWFVDLLVEARQGFWQVLPLNPTCGVYGNSPYSSFSAFACNPLLIDIDGLIEDGLISRGDIDQPRFSDRKVNYRAVTEYKNKILTDAYERNRMSIMKDHEFKRFLSEHSYWLDDYCLFIALKRQFRGIEWTRWQEDVRERREDTLNLWRERLNDGIMKEAFLQFLFFKQWQSLRRYCEERNIRIIGDIPIYVNHDSSDVWANTGLFKLNDDNMPVTIAGVPPDYFSSTGQLWGHPVYNWDAIRDNGYSWWIKRIAHNMKLFHIIKIDHFRGFVAYWEVEAGEKTAINGRWVKAPAVDFFNALLRHFNHLPIIAEDLGVITPDVREVMDMFGFPGMRVLMFGFGGDIAVNPYAPHNHIKNCVVYTGTHDNNTIRGWFRRELSVEDRMRLSNYIGRRVNERTIHRELIRLAMMSVADVSIIPMQDVLGLGEWARMNLPARKTGNWQWRLEERDVTEALIGDLSEKAMIYGRG